ncbi:MAG: DUF4231 domain-containing protein [Pseudomonadota bacterium]
MTDVDTFIAERLDDQITYFSNAAGREQGRGKQWQNTLIGAAALTPMLIALAELFEEPISSILRGLSLVSSALAAIATSVIATRKYWENGVAYRAREQALIREKILFQMRAGPYADGASDPPPDRLLVETVEAIIAEDVVGWTERMRDASKQASGKNSVDKKGVEDEGEASDASAPASGRADSGAS